MRHTGKEITKKPVCYQACVYSKENTCVRPVSAGRTAGNSDLPTVRAGWARGHGTLVNHIH